MADRPTPDERRFRALASSSVERLAEVDARGQAVYVSPSHEVAGETALASFGRVHPEDRAGVAAHFAAAFRDGSARRMWFRVYGLADATRWIDATLTPFLTEQGERHILVVSRDVTVAHEVEQQLRESRERFQLIAENAYDMIIECDSEWHVQYANERVRKVLGFGDVNVDLHSGYVHPDDRPRFAGMLASATEGRDESANSTYRVRRADGSWCWVDASLRTVQRRAGQQSFVLISRDATARVEAEQRVLESERRYRELVENAPLGILVIQGAEIVFANAAAAALYGVAGPEALCDKSMFELLNDDAARIVATAMARSDSGDRNAGTFAIRVAGAAGQERHLTGVGTIITYAGAPAFQCIVRDVTELERSRRDQERLALQLQEARKLESLGVLAGGIAHDFNNLLAVILSSVRYARSADATADERADALSDAEDATESAARLVRQLLAYAGRRSPEVRSVDLSELARSLSELLATALPGGVSLKLDLEPDPLQVHADLVQLEQVLMNLVLNAADAVGTGPGTVTVRTTRESFAAAELAQWIGGEALATGSYACLAVEDSGVGMDAETQGRIFEPFFSTKLDGHGLGLSAVLGLVQGHRGAIDVHSEVGVGTRIRVALPADPVPVHPARRRSGAALVLVAESDPDARRIATDALRAAGIEVLDAADVAHVLDLWARHADELDAVAIDTSLAAASGQPLARALRADRPDLPILALGRADDDPTAEGEPNTALVHKPLAGRAVCDAMIALLAKRSAQV